MICISYMCTHIHVLRGIDTVHVPGFTGTCREKYLKQKRNKGIDGIHKAHIFKAHIFKKHTSSKETHLQKKHIFETHLRNTNLQKHPSHQQNKNHVCNNTTNQNVEYTCMYTYIHTGPCTYIIYYCI